MVNRSYLNPEDDDLEDLIDDRSPYTSVSTNKPLIDPNAVTPPDEEETELLRDPASMPPVNPVMQMISSRNNLDPNMQQSDEREAQLERNLASQNQANFYSNMAHAGSRAAMGSNTPSVDDSFYTNLQNQNKDILKTREGSQSRRQLMMEAIQKRNQHALEKKEDRDWKEGQAVKDHAFKEKMHAVATGQRDDNRKFMQSQQTDKMLNTIQQQIEKDPVIAVSTLNLASLSKAYNTLTDTSAPLTSELFSDVEQDLASAMSMRQGATTEGKIARSEMDNWHRDWAKIKQRLGTKLQDLRTQAPELVEQAMKFHNILKKDYINGKNERYAKLIGGKKSVIGSKEGHARLDLLQKEMYQSPYEPDDIVEFKGQKFRIDAGGEMVPLK